MAIRPYLAMTAEEIRKTPSLPHNPAWIGCPFAAPLPVNLPDGCLLVLTDEITEVSRSPETIRAELEDTAAHLRCPGVVLDFQRPPAASSLALADLLRDFPCPVALSEAYAGMRDCAVFLSPAPPHMRLQDHLAPWRSRDIWLDISAWGQRITLTEAGCRFSQILPPFSGDGFYEPSLHCHYSTAITDEEAEFILWRTEEDLNTLLKEAEALGVTTVLGLLQELEGSFPVF